MEDDRQRDSENAGSSQMHGNEEDGRTDGRTVLLLQSSSIKASSEGRKLKPDICSRTYVPSISR